MCEGQSSNSKERERERDREREREREGLTLESCEYFPNSDCENGNTMRQCTRLGSNKFKRPCFSFLFSCLFTREREREGEGER